MMKGVRRVTAVAALTMGALALVAPARAAGDQLVVNVPEAFEIDGRVFPAGPLAVRHLGAYTPSIAMVRVTVGRECVGVLLVHLSEGASAVTGNAVVFDRSTAGHLTLAGFSVPGRRSQSFFAYKNRDRRDRIAVGPAVFIASR